MKKRKIVIRAMIVLVIIISFLLILNINRKKEVAKGIVEFSGEGKYWMATYIFDSNRYEKDHVNYFKLVSKEKDILTPIDNIDIEIISDYGLITGNIGNMEVDETINENGFQEITFLIGTVNKYTFLEDKYKLHMEFEDKTDKINLEYK